MATGYRPPQSKATISHLMPHQYSTETGGELFPFEIPADMHQNIHYDLFNVSLL